ncbi:START domain-containing protein [Cynara cardunculus var. scolymus]|uniref:START domain-containing protein n=1 Tax=Cynara cardunculus var. scolymus TaxID=59895 RepID=A0A103YEC4_CYNCS|nr:START domain-containing protein [Cynara cardunculus var. scolymus]
MLLVDPFSEILRTPTVGVLVLDMLLLLVLVSIAFFIGITVGWSWKPTWVSNFAIKHQTVGTNNVDLGSSSVDRKMDKQPFKLQPSMENPSCSSSVVKKENNLLTDGDLKHLWHLVEKRDGDATPELLRDFFWDDDLRLKWDDMLLHATTLEEFRDVGASVVHWIRRFPFFCSDREYTIGRRMWDLEGSFYCVTKGVSCPLVPRKQKPRLGSKKGNNQPASEVVFFHHEDMGIPWEIAKFAVSQGMWGTARKVERGFRWYQNERICSKTTSPHIAMAEMSTKIDQNYLARLESDEDHDVAETEMVVQQEKQGGINLPKLLVIGGAVILACSLDRGLLTKGVIFRVARRFGNVGRRFPPTQL